MCYVGPAIRLGLGVPLVETYGCYRLVIGNLSQILSYIVYRCLPHQIGFKQLQWISWSTLGYVQQYSSLNTTPVGLSLCCDYTLYLPLSLLGWSNVDVERKRKVKILFWIWHRNRYNLYFKLNTCIFLTCYKWYSYPSFDMCVAIFIILSLV